MAVEDSTIGVDSVVGAEDTAVVDEDLVGRGERREQESRSPDCGLGV